MDPIQQKEQQEQYCIEAMRLIELLRTKLFDIDDFYQWQKYNKILMRLKNKIYNVYWDL